MQVHLFCAALLAMVVGAIHSVLGEILIFSRMRERGIVPTVGEPLLQERHVRILWATWHMVIVFGWTFGAILLRIAIASDHQPVQAFVQSAIAVSMLGGAMLVLVATRCKHPGWLGLLGVSALIWLG